MSDVTKKCERRVLCAQPPRVPVVLPSGLAPNREFAIRVAQDKWANGTILHFCFLPSGQWDWPDAQKAVVRWAFQRWMDQQIGISFKETDQVDEAEIRIGFRQDNRSWSFVGTEILDNKDLGRTMNYGWDLTTTWGRATALHEIGHTLGLAHEHQNPKAGIIWNEDRVYEVFSGPPNSWDRDTIYNNIIAKIPANAIEGSPWSPDSIMEYPFEPGLIKSPKPYDEEGVPENIQLSATDIAWVRRFYPAGKQAIQIAPMQLQRLDAQPGGQCDFSFEPNATRDYQLQTVGAADSKIVVFEERDGVPRFFAADDDSGKDGNATIKAHLVKGRRYTIRVRVHFVSGDGVGFILF